jgi:ribosomal protein L3 glutamine methyltransferase
MTTVAELIEAVSREFEAAGLVFGHGTDNAWDEATALVLGVSGLADHRASLALCVEEPLLGRIESLKQRRINERIPLAYLLGVANFAGLKFQIEPGTVIPRSPIGELITQGFKPWLLSPPETVLDLCCGSGCIGIATALRFPDSRVLLIEKDPGVLGLAQRNIAMHGLEDRVTLLESDLFDQLPSEQTFDLILSNPPYVDRVDMTSLPAEYRHEPVLGLDGGQDGLEIVRRILDARTTRLSATGVLVCEVGMSAAAVLRAYPRTPFIWPEFSQGGAGVFILPAH